MGNRLPSRIKISKSAGGMIIRRVNHALLPQWTWRTLERNWICSYYPICKSPFSQKFYWFFLFFAFFSETKVDKKRKPSTTAEPKTTTKKVKPKASDTDITSKLIKKIRHQAITVYHILARHVYLIILGAVVVFFFIIVVLCLRRYGYVTAQPLVSSCRTKVYSMHVVNMQPLEIRRKVEQSPHPIWISSRSKVGSADN